jgi:hypothetical protein
MRRLSSPIPLVVLATVLVLAASETAFAGRVDSDRAAAPVVILPPALDALPFPAPRPVRDRSERTGTSVAAAPDAIPVSGRDVLPERPIIVPIPGASRAGALLLFVLAGTALVRKRRQRLRTF